LSKKLATKHFSVCNLRHQRKLAYHAKLYMMSYWMYRMANVADKR